MKSCIEYLQKDLKKNKILVEAGPGSTKALYENKDDWYFNPITHIYLAVFNGLIDHKYLG